MQKVKKLKIKLLPFLTILPIASAMACFLLFPARYSALILEGATLFAVCVMPATLPCLFLTALLTRQKIFRGAAEKIAPAAKKIFRVSGAGGLCALLSALSGYPVGARTTLDLYERGAIPKGELFRVACLASTSGPMFLVGAVGAGMFESATIGWIIFCAHLSGNYLVCFLLRFAAKKPNGTNAPLPALQNGGTNVIADSVLSVLTVGGAIALFYAFSGILRDTLVLAGIENGYIAAIVTGAVEMTSGCKLLSEIGSGLSVALSAFLVTFGGGCVIAQQLSFLSRAGVKTLPFLGVKLLQGAFAALFAFGFHALL